MASAVRDGARMLGLDDRIGSLTPGQQADIILIDARGVNMRPVRDPVASALFHAGPRDVDTVMIAGTVTKQTGRLVSADLDRLMDEVSAIGDRIMSAFHNAADHYSGSGWSLLCCDDTFVPVNPKLTV